MVWKKNNNDKINFSKINFLKSIGTKITHSYLKKKYVPFFSRYLWGY